MIIKYILGLFIFFILNRTCQIRKIFLNKTKFSKHKKFIDNSSELTVLSGLFLVIGNLALNFNLFDELQFLFYVSFFVVGFVSDRVKNFSPFLRIILQIFIIYFFVYNFDVRITNIKINILNDLLQINIISLIFTTFCIIVLVNGSNFIDGINISSIGYYLGVLVSIYYLSNNFNLILNKEFVEIQILLLGIILFFNIMNKSYLGDGGIYFISFITSVIIIKFINLNHYSVSPFFAVSILWYPCFENLFSIFRKKMDNLKVSDADNRHLHHLIYVFIKKKLNLKMSNNISGLIILFYNYIVFYLSVNFYNQSKNLIFLILISILIYSTVYLFLRKKLKIIS